jgi:hypothetical protein
MRNVRVLVINARELTNFESRALEKRFSDCTFTFTYEPKPRLARYEDLLEVFDPEYVLVSSQQGCNWIGLFADRVPHIHAAPSGQILQIQPHGWMSRGF